MRKINVYFQISYILINISVFLLGLNFLLLQTIPSYSVPLRNSVRMLALLIAITSIFFYPEPIVFSTPDILMLLLSIPGCVVSRFESNHLLFLSLILICLKPYSIQECIKICKNASVLIFLTYIALYEMGYIKWIVYGVYSWRRRNTLGFNNVNAAMLLFLSLVVIWILDSPTVKKALIGAAFIQWVFFETNSRTGYLAFLVFMFFMILRYVNLALAKRRSRISEFQAETDAVECSKTESRFERRPQTPGSEIFGELLIQIIALLLVLWPFFAYYLNQWFPFLDSLLSYRVSIAIFVVRHLTPEQLLFGGVGGMDHVGLCLLAEYGAFMLVFFVYRIFRSIKNAVKYRNATNLAILLSSVTLSSAESALIRPEILISIVFWKSILYDYRDEYGKGGFHEDSLYNK